MITVIATFRLPRPITLADAKALFEGSAPKYRGLKGLVRKVYVLSEDGATAGGVYLWRSRADAEALYTDEWKAFVRDRYGCDPSLQFLHSPVIVDNASDEVRVD